jgi:hypothetical protein
MMEGEHACSVITKAIINQIDPDGNINMLYEINRLPEVQPPTIISHPYEIKLYYPELQADPNKPIRWIKHLININAYINKLRKYFDRGRIMNVKFLYPIKGIFSRTLTYNQTKAILRFENRASRRLVDKPEAIRSIDPTKINEFIKCDHYIIESWKHGLERHSYTTITHDPDMDAWIRTMQDEY